jgi:hypothetical protein
LSLLVVTEFGENWSSAIGACLGCTALVIMGMSVAFPGLRAKAISLFFRSRPGVPVQM